MQYGVISRWLPCKLADQPLKLLHSTLPAALPLTVGLILLPAEPINSTHAVYFIPWQMLVNHPVPARLPVLVQSEAERPQPASQSPALLQAQLLLLALA